MQLAARAERERPLVDGRGRERDVGGYDQVAGLGELDDARVRNVEPGALFSISFPVVAYDQAR